jgi:hypothetical protein
MGKVKGVLSKSKGKLSGKSNHGPRLQNIHASAHVRAFACHSQIGRALICHICLAYTMSGSCHGITGQVMMHPTYNQSYVRT